MYVATIKVNDPGRIIERAFIPEDKDIKGKASYSVSHKKGMTHFAITAKDATALRIVANSITKMLKVIESMKELK